jgi:ubiquinone/menaquinone biosynthesis C-methylase UbiE
MHRIEYNDLATVYDQGRAVPLEGLEAWHAVLSRYLPPASRRLVLDVGSGTGIFAYALAQWFDTDVIALEPSDGMRQEAIRLRSHSRITYLAGEAEHLPLDDGSCGAAWLSTVIHHLPDLRRSAQEIRRVLCPESPVLIRSAFPGRLDGITLFQFFSAARQVAEGFPRVEDTVNAFGSAGFRMEHLESVPQVTSRSLTEFYERARLRADTTLQCISNEEFAWGLEALERAAIEEIEPVPVIDRLDLLVFR